MTKPYRIPIRGGADRTKARAACDRVPVGWAVVFKPPVRTLAQNDRMWPFLEDIARQKDWPAGSGKMRTRYFWKDLMTAALTSQEIVPGLEGGLVAIGQHTSEMGVEEMSDLLQLIEAWGANHEVNFTDSPVSTATQTSGEQRAAAKADGESRADAAARNLEREP